MALLRFTPCLWVPLARHSVCFQAGVCYLRIATFLIFATVNALVRGSRKNAANCDTHCDVRNSEIRQVFERILYIEFYLMYI